MAESEQTQRVAVSARSDSETKTVVEARTHEVVLDEPEAAGGTDEGPTPVEHLLAAWAGCLNATVRAVAPDFDLVVEGVAVDLEGAFDPRKHLGEATAPRAGYQRIDVTLDVDFAGAVDEETRAAFTAAVEQRCPVGDNIQHPTETDVTLRPS